MISNIQHILATMLFSGISATENDFRQFSGIYRNSKFRKISTNPRFYKIPPASCKKSGKSQNVCDDTDMMRNNEHFEFGAVQKHVNLLDLEKNNA